MYDLEQITNRLDKIEKLLESNKDVLTLDEVATFTSLSKSTIYKLTSRAEIPCYRPKGKQLYFNRAEIQDWLLSNRQKPNYEIEAEVSGRLHLGK